MRTKYNFFNCDKLMSTTPFQINDEPEGSFGDSKNKEQSHHMVPMCTRSHINFYMNNLT